MVNKVLIDYIHSEFERGIPKETIRQMLIESGWQIADIDAGETIVYTSPNPLPTNPVSSVAPSQPLQQPVHIQRPIQQAVQQQTTQPIQQPIQKPNLAAALEAHRQKTAQTFQPMRPTMQFPMDQTTQPAAAQPTTSQPISVQHIDAKYRTAEPIVTMQQHVPKKSKWRFAKVFVVILLILISGGAAYGYYTGYFEPSAQVSGNIVTAMTEAKSVSFDIAIDSDMSQVKIENDMLSMMPGFAPTMSFMAQGVYDKSQVDNTISNAVLSFSAGTFVIGGETRFSNKNLYIKATALPMIPLFDLATYKDQWLSIPFDQTASDVSTAQASIPLIGTTIVNAATLSNLSLEQKQHITEMAENGNFITVTKRFLPQKVGDVLVQHFAFTINTEAISQFLLELSAYAAIDTAPTRESISSMRNFVGEAWIGKADHLPYKITAAFDSQEGTDPTSIAKTTFTLLFKDWNVPIAVETPVDSLPFSQFLEKSLSDAQNQAIDDNIRTTIADLRAEAESYFDGNNLSYKNFCKSPAYSDLLTNMSSEDQKTTGCRDSVAAYVTYTKLSAATGLYFCSDSTGTSIELAKPPTGLVCK